MCPTIATVGGAITQFGNTIKNTATKVGSSLGHLLQKGAGTINKAGSSPAVQKGTTEIALRDFTIKYGQELGSKMNQVAEFFRKENISASEHAILRIVTREIRGVTPEKVIDVLKNGSKYFDNNYPNTLNYFKDGIRVVTDKATNKIITVVTQTTMNPSRFINIK